VIDRGSGTLFVTAKTIARGAGSPASHYRLHALRLTDGTDSHQPAEITGSVPGNGATSVRGHIIFDPKYQHNRPGLLLVGRTIYLAFASHCDIAPYYGWIFGYNADTLAQVSILNTSPDKSKRPYPRGFSDSGAGIWQGGIGVAADGQGFLYCQTGNGPFDLDLGGKDCGDTVLKLRSDLALAGYFTPHNQEDLNKYDQDLGSGGVMLLPDQAGPHPHLMVSCGKEGTVYLMDRANPGGFHANADRVLRSLPNSIERGVWGGPAYYSNAEGQRIYYCGARDHGVGGLLWSLSLHDGVIGVLKSSTESFSNAGTPTVSSNGPAPGTGVVWLTGVSGANSINLLAFDADDVTHKLLDVRAGPFNNGPKFTVPTVADGRVFVGTDNTLAVFSL
jgi:hypothetical protein